MDDSIERMLRTFPRGARVVAALDIIYGVGPEVAEGTLGMVTGVLGTGVAYVQWEGVDYPLATSVDSIDPEPAS